MIVGWGRDDTRPSGQPEVEVVTATRLDAILDRIEADAHSSGRPITVEITSTVDHVPDDDGEPWLPYGLTIGVGHPERSFALYIGEHGGAATGRLAAPDAPIDFDQGGEPTPYPPDQLCITPAQAREAARQYLATGVRPTVLEWATADHTG